jgi:hypothetical protein
MREPPKSTSIRDTGGGSALPKSRKAPFPPGEFLVIELDENSNIIADSIA